MNTRGNKIQSYSGLRKSTEQRVDHARSERNDRFRIALLEDNASDADLIQHQIRLAWPDAELSVSSTKEACLDLIRREEFDLILSDYNVPGVVEDECLQLAQQEAPRSLFIYISGALDDSLAENLIEKGAHGFISKDDLERLPDELVRIIKQNGYDR